MGVIQFEVPAFPGKIKGFSYVYCEKCGFEDWNRWMDAKSSARYHHLHSDKVAAVLPCSFAKPDYYFPEKAEKPGFAMQYLLQNTECVE